MAKLRKRIAAGILSAMMTLSLVGCNSGTTSSSSSSSTDTSSSTSTGGSSSTSEPGTPGSENLEEADLTDIIPKETVKLNVYSQLSNFSGMQQGWFAKVMKDKFNVELNIIDNADGTFATRLESKDLGDIVLFGNEGDFAKAVQAGLLLDWEDEDILKDYGPYMNANLTSAFEKNRAISGSDGKIHGFGFDVAMNASREDVATYFYHPSVRFDLYQQAGSPAINTLEDYVDVFAKMQEICPTTDTGKKTYGVSMFSDWDGDMVMFVKATAAIYGYDEFGFGLYDMNTQTYQDALDKNGMYLRCLKFYNTLYQRGLVDPDSMTQTFDDCYADYKDGAAFFNLFTWMSEDAFNTPENLAAGKYMYAIPPLDAKNFVDGLSPNGGERVWTIGAKTQYPELCMAILNYFCTPDGFMTTQHGPKGVTWDYDEKGEPYLTELGISAKNNKQGTVMPDGATFEDGEFKMNLTTWSLDSKNPKNGIVYNHKLWDSYNKQLKITPIEQAWRDWSGCLTADEYLQKNNMKSVHIRSTYSALEKSQELQSTWSQVQQCIRDYSWKAIYAKTDAEYDQLVDEMITKANEYGYQQCVEYQQNEAVRRKAAEDEALKNMN